MLGLRASGKGNAIMATTTKPADVYADVPVEEWQQIDTEAQVKFDTIGDVFIGKFLGWTKTDNEIPQAHFDSSQGKVFINLGWDLKNKLRDAKVGTIYRIELIAMQDTGQASAMMVFNVRFRKP